MRTRYGLKDAHVSAALDRGGLSQRKARTAWRGWLSWYCARYTENLLKAGRWMVRTTEMY